MADFRYILFDLDGTVTDSGIGVTNSVMYALNKTGVKVSDRRELFKFIGPPLWDSFERFYGFTKAESEKAVECYREYYEEKGIYECELYEGIEALLKTLKESGKFLILATSKPEFYAKQIIKNLGIDKYFDFAAGSTMDRTRNEKDQVITYALNSCKIDKKQNSIMIGDREHDILGAKNNGISSIGVLYGYGSREELIQAGADYISEDAAEIEKILLN